MSRSTARTVGDLHRLLRVAVTGLPPDAAPRIRVRHDQRGQVDACELWGVVGRNPNHRWLCGLTVGIGLSMQLVANAAENARLTYPIGDPQRRGHWRQIQPLLDGNLTASWFDLELVLPDVPSSRDNPALQYQ
ncbi:hypothetical protein [Myceligenerans cantabricum]